MKGRQERDRLQFGGPLRDLDVLVELQVNKLQLRYDVYPETAAQASRQLLLVHNVTVVDRLGASDIKKFMHHYESADLPKLSHKPMVGWK